MLKNVFSEPQFENCLNYLFSNTMVAPNLEVASSVTRLHKLNCVTTDGDKVSKGGPMTGYFYFT